MNVWLPGPAIAEEGEAILHIAPADSPLVIRGVLIQETTSFSADVRLRLSGAEYAPLVLLASEFRHDSNPNEILDHSRISIPDGISLNDKLPRDIRVSVNGVRRPGNYSGELKFLLPEQKEADALIMPLKMEIDAQPDVVPPIPQLSMMLAHCQNPVDCLLASWLLPEGTLRNEWLLPLDNRTLTPADILSGATMLQRDKSGIVLSASELQLELPSELSADSMNSIHVNADPKTIPPDHYSGILRISLKNQHEPLNVNMTLDVRNGPLLPVLIVLLGIMIGRMARSMESPEAQTQARLYPRYADLRADAGTVTYAKSAGYLSGQLRQFKKKLDEGKDPEEALNAELKKLEAKIAFLRSLEALEHQIVKQRLEALAESLKPQFDEAREAIRDDKLDMAKLFRNEIEERLKSVQADSTMGKDEKDGIESALKNVHESKNDLVDAYKHPAPSGGKQWAWLNRVPAFLAGSQTIGTELRFWLLRPLLFTTLLILLALLGLKTLYIDAGATFGASGFYDYLGLFLWGLSADVAQRTLQNLGKTK